MLYTIGCMKNPDFTDPLPVLSVSCSGLPAGNSLKGAEKGMRL